MCHIGRQKSEAKIAQLGERMTEDHKVRCSIHLLGAFFFFLEDIVDPFTIVSRL